MRIKDPSGVYHVLETLLKQDTTPLTCTDLFDDPDVKRFCQDAGRVSDYLGHMYRRGIIGRVPMPKSVNSQARWGYFWKDGASAKPQAVPKTSTNKNEIERDLSNETKPSHQILSKPNIVITDDGSTIVIDLPELTITIRSKN